MIITSLNQRSYTRFDHSIHFIHRLTFSLKTTPLIPASSVISSFVLVKKPFFATDVDGGSTVPVKRASRISQREYREAVRSEESIDWRCVECEAPILDCTPMPILNSTPMLFTDDEQEQSDLPADPDADFEPQSPDQYDSPADPDADFEPQSPDQYDSPVDPALDESSLAESPTAAPSPSSSFAFSLQVIDDCTNKGRPKLIDSRGFSYGIKRRRANATDWVCTMRPKVNIAKKKILITL